MDLVFEIGCEELPASFIEPALDQLEEGFLKRLGELRITVDKTRGVGTPRRLTLLASGLAERQSDLEEERTGPPANVAFRDGEPTKAAEGFARGQGVSVDDLYTVETDKGTYVAAKVFDEGKPTAELLPEVLDGLIADLHFPKSMRWAARRETFARPVRWIVAVADGQVLPVAFAGVEAGDQTYGHRFAAPGAITVSSAEGYLADLREAHVVADPNERRETIIGMLADLGEDLGAAVIEDPGLLHEVTYLVEEPHLVCISFGDGYLELPDEVLISSMRSHQRYFSIADADTGDLRSLCAIIYNTPVDDPQQVYEGNLRVLRARLDDAKFFWEQDLKRPLEAYVDKLADVVWLAKIGTMKGRSERIARLSRELAGALEMSDETAAHAERAGLLSKADLATAMVYEFPDLQGVMGREYALKSGEDEAVAQAIFEQYLPRGVHIALPDTDAGACVALAEKLDALVGCFGIDMVPSSNADPYGLRRAALGVIRILEDSALSVRLSDILGLAIDGYDALAEGKLDKDRQVLIDELVDFIGTRLRYQLAEAFPTDIVDAVLAADCEDIVSAVDRTGALAELRVEEDFEPLALGFKRVVNILKKQAEAGEVSAGVDVERFADDAERELFAAYQTARAEVAEAVSQRDWPAAFRALIALKAPVDAFFDEVMVMADDDALRQNRLALLAALRELFFEVADISRVQ